MSKDASSDIPSNRAARKGRTSVVRLLLEADADPNFEHESAQKPLSTAVQDLNTDAVRLLLARSADPNPPGERLSADGVRNR